MATRKYVLWSLLLEPALPLRLSMSGLSGSHRSCWVHPINQRRHIYGEFNHLMPQLRTDDSKFFDYFRMNQETFQFILHVISPYICKKTTHFRVPICAEERLVVTLRYLATGASFRSLAFTFRMGRSTIADIVEETCHALWTQLQPLYLPEPTKESCEKTAKEYFNKWNFPNVIGSIDGKHCRLKCPANAGSNYFNYKHYHSFVLQAIADANYKFMVVDVGAYGKESDGGIFQRSKIRKWLEENHFDLPDTATVPETDIDIPLFILGDAAYPLRKFLITPYASELDAQKRIFNYRHSRARRCVESAFGILTAKWRVLNTAIEVQVEKAVVVVLATIVLHNTVIALEGVRLQDQPRDQSQDILPNHRVAERNHVFRGRPATHATWIRDQLKDYFNGPTGAVPWQNGKI